VTEFRPPDEKEDRKILLLEAKRYIETGQLPSDVQPVDEKSVKSESETFIENLTRLSRVLKELAR